LGLFGPVT
jgi:hypothetical protein